MNTKKSALISAAILSSFFNVATQAQTTTVIIDDVLNGTTTQAELQGSYFTSSSGDALEFNAVAGGTSGDSNNPSSGPLESIGLVSGGSGRTIHVLLPDEEQITLEAAGDSVTSSVTFTTSATINNDAQINETFRFNIVDHLGRVGETVDGVFNPQLAANTSFGGGATSQNPLYNGLLGYLAEAEVRTSNVAFEASDLTFREFDPAQTNGQFSGSTSCCFSQSQLGSGPDLGYIFEPNSTYTYTFTITRTATNGIDLEQTLVTPTETFSNVGADDTPESFNFGLFALGVSSDAFGLDASTLPFDADNGIDITAFSVSFFDADGVASTPSDTDETCFPVVGTDGTSVVCL